MRSLVKRYLFILTGIIFLFFLSFFSYKKETYIQKGNLELSFPRENKFYLRGKAQNIEIFPSKNSNSKIKIEYTKIVKANNQSIAKKVFQKMSFASYQQGDILVYKPIIRKVKLSGIESIFPPIYKLKLKIYIPLNREINLKLSCQNLIIKNLKWKNASISLNKGNIKLSNVSGNFSILTYKGNITGNNIKGSGKIFTARGNINLNNIKGAIITSSPKGNTSVNHDGKSLIAQK